ncbi:hypothetical protein CCL18_22325 [Pseudomonas syringae]|nr:hypothetical protein CCL18_22325 [Pseudomonas syringae]
MNQHEQGVKLDVSCPKCGATPLMCVTDREPVSGNEYQDHKCPTCGSVLSEDEIRAAQKAAMDKFMKSHFGKR